MSTVEGIYQARRDRQAKLRDERIAKIYEDHPQLNEINRQIGLKNVALAKSRLVKSDQIEKQELELHELQGQRDRYMKDYQIDPEDFKLHYDCNLCKDWGYIVSENKHSKCSCLLKIQEGLRQGQAHLTNKLDKENFGTFRLDLFDNTKKVEIYGGLKNLTERENIQEIRKAALHFIQNFRNKEEKSMLYYGGVGLGKSFMCYCIAKELLDRGYTVLYLTMNEFMDIMQLYHFDRSIFFDRYTLEDYYAVEQADLFILDDLGTEITNSFVKTVLFNTVNSRMINNKKMIISTNLMPGELIERYDERITSRITEYMDSYQFFGDNKRWG